MSANAMQMLGVEAAAGRALAPDDDNAKNTRVVMLSYGLWQRRFGGTNEVLGKTLTLNGDSYTIVGVLPSRFVIPNAETEIMVPLRMDQDPRRTQRGSNFLRVVARLKPGVTPGNRICRCDSDHTFDEDPFVCSGAERSNDLCHFFDRFNRRRIVGMLYSGTTGNESRSTSCAEIRIRRSFVAPNLVKAATNIHNEYLCFFVALYFIVRRSSLPMPKVMSRPVYFMQ